MLTKEQLCKKIEDVAPGIGVCGVDLNVDYDKENRAWTVDLKRGERHLKTFLENPEAESCVLGKKCISLGVQIGQLRSNLDSLEH